MLDEYKKSYEECASIIKDWKKLSALELCSKYIDTKDNNSDLSESYLSAIILKYWHIISRTYFSQKVKIATEEDVYNWFIEGILAAVNTHCWTDPKNSLYQDELGPEKAISVCIYSAKLNFFEALNYDKRKIHKFSYSLDELEENSSDGYYFPYHDKTPYMEMYMYKKIRSLFEQYNYFTAFLLDAIVNVDVFSKNIDGSGDVYRLSDRKLIKHLRNIDNRYIQIFSNTYDLDKKEIKQGADFIKNLDSNRMHKNIVNLLFVLKHDKELINYLRS